MTETKKERYTSYLPSDLVEKLRDVSDKTGIPQSKLLEKAVRDLLDKHEVFVEYFPIKE